MREPDESSPRRIGLNEVLNTEDLTRRPQRPTDHAAEADAIASLIDALVADPRSIPQALVDSALTLCRAESVGINIREPGHPGFSEERFRWLAVSGSWAKYKGEVLSRSENPSGLVLDRNSPILFDRPGRHYTTLSRMSPEVYEALIVPFQADGNPVGTIWAIHHEPSRSFDIEDLRLLTRLARFASASHRIIASREAQDDVRADTEPAGESGEIPRDSLLGNGEKFRALVNLFAQATWETDAGGKIVTDLPDWQAYTGQLPGEAWSNAVHPDDREAALANWQSAIASGAPLDSEFRLRDSEGHWRWTNVRATPLRYRDGSIRKWVGMNVDITTRKEAENALRELLAAGQMAYWIWDPDGETLIVSEWMAELFGLPPGESRRNISQNFQVVHPEDRPRLQTLTEQGLRKGEGWHTEFRVIRPSDGSTIWLEERARVSHDPAIGKTRFHGLIWDITDRKQAEATVRASEERLRLALSAARMGVWLWDVGGDEHVRDANLNRLLGLEPVETRQPFAEFLALIHPDDRAIVDSAFHNAIRKGHPLNVEFRVVRPDGAVHWLRDQGDLFHVAEGHPPRLAGACIDVTDLKEAEEALRHSRDELEERVVERTEELARANTAIHNEMVARTELLRRLVSAQEDERRRIARDLHDGLGQELTALLLGLGDLEKVIPEDSDKRERLRDVESAAARIGREIHDLAVDLRPTALDDLGLAPALATYVARWSERTGVNAEFQRLGFDGDRFPSEIETTVYRVIQEALNNVAKHAGARFASVIVERRANELIALVEDDGRGFNPSRSLEAERQSLGLLGMRERVSLVAGTLLIESEPGQGTTVRVRIPLEPASEGPADGG